MANFTIENLIEKYKQHPNHKKLKEYLEKDNYLSINGLANSLETIFLSSDDYLKSKNLIFVANDIEQAAYIYNDFQAFCQNKRDVFFYPFSHKNSFVKNAQTSISPEFLLSKTEVLGKVNKSSNFVLVTYPIALAENVISNSDLKNNTLEIKVGDTLSSNFILEVLDQYGFERTEFIFQPGQYSQRGSIIDIFSFSNELPYRLDFFGDEIDSIRTFDVMNQLSIDKVEQISIIPNICLNQDDQTKIPFLEYIPKDSVIYFKDLDYCQMEIKKVESINIKSNEEESQVTFPRFTDLETFNQNLKKHKICNCIDFNHNNSINFNSLPQPNFKKNFQLIAQNIKEYQDNNYSCYISVLNEKQNIRLNDIFLSNAVQTNIKINSLQATLYQGFVDNDLKICLFTDHQIFDRYLKYKLKESQIRKTREAITMNELNSLKPGDYVVHQDHGVGIFGGLEQIENNGKTYEVIKVGYKDNDILYVSIHSLHKISKYKGSEGDAPKIFKLGSGTWNKLKQKTKSRVKDIAKDLIKLYAQRRQQKGFAFSADSYLQQALEASFIYEDTPDQEKATIDVKHDMEAETPMDRLVCGDVGFGKTEIAIRAAFKAACDGKQVAVLVPTTILALQHYKTFSERLKDLPCTVDYLSRLRTTKECKDVINRLKEGQIDIIIGTHKIVGKDIQFKDLGLLIIDEEQKFGVAVKEKLKQIKLNVDTLTLTATPIPRTLQFSLLGARDLSIIATPPSNRYPIVTEVHTFDTEIIKSTIGYELDRNGQVFIIQNRINKLYETQAMVEKMFPQASVLCAHGQMDGKVLEDLMLSFVNEEADILISTTIIESGLDIPNANTIIVMDAQNFGLSELHQLRGRVGRSNKRAFCYLFAPPKEVLTQQARQRLKAIEGFSELGSGYNIAMQDLDIRGAGNLLGGEQSGFISEIGMETYQKILDEAITELKEQEYQDIIQGNQTEETKQEAKKILSQIKYVNDCTVDTDFELMFPEEYIENITERVKLYRKLDSLKKEEELINFEKTLEDRFGKLPEVCKQLFNIVRIRWVAIELGIQRINLKNNNMKTFFVENMESPYYQSNIFGKILNYINANPRFCSLSQANGKPCMSVKNIQSPKHALEILTAIKKNN